MCHYFRIFAKDKTAFHIVWRLVGCCRVCIILVSEVKTFIQ